MKIKTLEIYGYGKWVNQKFELGDQLQLFYGKNEAGKSTLQSFIRSMLFGFPSRRRRVNQQNRYEPKQHETYGGRMLLTETDFGDIWVERTSKALRVTRTDGEELPAKTLDEVLGGLDEKLFDNFYAFSLQNLQELANIGADQLNDYFMSIGTVGSDQFLKIAKQYQKETDDLYRPNGQSRPLNVLLAEYEELAQQVEVLHLQMGAYDELTRRRQEEEEAIARLNQEIKDLEKEIRAQDKLVGLYDIYLKDRAAKRELEQLVFTPLSEQTVREISDALKLNQASEIQIVQLEERIRNLKGELGSLTKLNWARNHAEDRQKWLVETAKAKETQTVIEQLTARIQEQGELMTQLAHQGQFFPEKVEQGPAYDAKLEEGLALQADKLDLLKQEEALKAERKVYLEQRKEQQNYTAIVRQQVVHLEHQRMNEEAQLMQATSLNQYFPGILAFAGGLFLAFYQNMTKGANLLFWLGVLILVVGVLSIAYIFQSNRRRYQAFYNSPVLNKIQDLREKEIQYLEQSKVLGTQINQREEAIEAIEAELKNLASKQSRWLAAMGFYPTADPELILKANPVKQYFAAENQKKDLEAQKDKLTQQLTEWRSLLQPLFERFPLVDDTVRQQIRHVEDVEVSLVRTMERGQVIDDRLDEAAQQMKAQEDAIAERQAMIGQVFKDTHAQDELDFFQKVETNQLIEELTAKRALYAEQMEGYEEALTQVQNKQSLLENFHRLEHQLETLKERLVPHHRERADLEVEIHHLEQDGTYQEKVQALANKETQVRDMVALWGRKRIAMELIYATLRHGLDNPLPEMNRLADELFETLSYGRYTQIKLQKDGIKVRQFSDIYFEPHELSQGTLEQLYVALRIAFIENVRTMVKMPILIDDAFVNFDEYRKASMYQVLGQISERIQVLFFTFDQQAVHFFDGARAVNLDAIQVTQAEEEPA
ncbi:AAA family ATPase [uncultured Abiotrophia sp.]|uniref:ATP-binding protein n=1 Tax=uncultured Abiotrophia sp. TaxID=316094 RepID=UPI0028D05289|nr:AAA family ATPase [uncultured Abiotrophia sp.]